jgi:sensor histidine kinase YesM
LSYPFNRNRLAFNITVPYYFNADKIEFRYRLTGLYNDWTSNGNNHIISFTALPPGEYELAVAASTNGKIWYETKQPLAFTINPPFWKTWWFIAVTGLVAGIILFVLQKRREDILKKKEEEKLQKQRLVSENLQYRLEANQAQLAVLENERKAATAKLQSMRLQMNPHFLFNALNSIQQMIMTGNEKNATLYLSKFSKLLRLVLTHSDREVVSLREETEMLKLYIELEALRFEDTFTYKVEIESGIDTDDNKVPTLLIQPFVENAIWHGLLHKEGPRKLNVLFSMNKTENLVCTVEDNGIGREAAKTFARKTAPPSNHTGKGVAVADERLKIFNQQNGDSSRLEITDITDNAGNIAGTRVTITLPDLA